MKWIKYQIVQSTKGQEVFLINKKVGYDEVNLVIAQKEAYNGQYTIEEDEQELPKDLVSTNNIDMNGYGIKNLKDAVDDLDVVNLKQLNRLIPTKVIKEKNAVIKDSSDLPFVSMKMYGKTTQVKTNGYQLFDAKGIMSGGYETSYNVSNDGYIVKVVGGAQSTYTGIYAKISNATSYANKKLYFKIDKIVRSQNVGYVSVTIIANGKNTAYTLNSVGVKEIAVPADVNAISVSITVNGDKQLATDNTVVVEGMMLSLVNADWEPYTGGKPSPSMDNLQELKSVGAENGQIESKVRGFQLFDASKLSTYSASGATLTNNGDGSFTVSGSGTLSSGFTRTYDYTHAETVKLLKAGLLKLNIGQTIPSINIFILQGGKVVDTVNYGTKSTTISQETLDDESTKMRISIYASSGSTIVSGTVKPMLYQDGDGTWEPYKEQSLITPVADGLKGLPLGETIPDAIASSPVHMSGVWYDEEEKQYYIGDTVDYESGKYIKRINEKIYDGSEDENWYTYQAPLGSRYYLRVSIGHYGAGFDDVHLCNYEKHNGNIAAANETIGSYVFNSASNSNYNLYIRFENPESMTADNFRTVLAEKPLTLQYILTTPVETDLPESEILAYKALHTNKPTTTIMNDCDAIMEVEYYTQFQDGAFGKVMREMALLKEQIASLKTTLADVTTAMIE